jgi:hypothetical protein
MLYLTTLDLIPPDVISVRADRSVLNNSNHSVRADSVKTVPGKDDFIEAERISEAIAIGCKAAGVGVL